MPPAEPSAEPARNEASPAGSVPRVIQIARFWLVLAGIGGVLCVASAFLPWVALRVTATPEIRNGIETGGDGYITIALGLLVVVVAVRAWRSATGPTRRAGTIILIAGFFLLAFPALRWADVRSSMAAIDAGIAALTSPEIGLYGTALGGLLAILGGWQLRRVVGMPERAERAERRRRA